MVERLESRWGKVREGRWEKRKREEVCDSR
jgi:hypothetical protein